MHSLGTLGFLSLPRNAHALTDSTTRPLAKQETWEAAEGRRTAANFPGAFPQGL